MNLITPICLYLAFNNLNNKNILKIKVKNLVEDNTKLLHYFGNTYQKRHNLNKDEYNDLIQDGYFGLHRAAEKYDENKNVKFGSYASWWIKAYMTKNVKDYYKSTLGDRARAEGRITQIVKDELKNQFGIRTIQQEFSFMNK